MGTTTAESMPAAKTAKSDGDAEKPAPRTRRPRRSADDGASSGARYFLSKTNQDADAPALDRELASEGEALVEALRLGVTFYAIQEFRVVPDFAAKVPQLRKEAVLTK